MALSDDEQRQLFEAICKPRASLVEGSSSQFDAPTFSQTADYHAYHAHKLAQENAARLAEIERKLGIEGK